MNRFFLIFQKDVRHFWKEVILSWCLLALYVDAAAKNWNGGAGAYARAVLGITSSFITFALLLSWCLLVMRVVQDERLVGDRQFWVTRPYRWPELLAEKIFFLLLFINLPLLIAQLGMLKLAGFAALPYLGALLYVHTVLLSFGVAIFIAAVMTATLVQFTLLAFIALLYMVAHSALVALIPNSSMARAGSPLDTIASVATICTVIAVILIQYAQRRTALTRGIIGGLALLAILLALMTPYSKLIAQRYPRLNEAAPMVMSLDTRKPESQSFPSTSGYRPAKPAKNVLVNIPFLASNVDNDDMVRIEGDRVRVYLPNGQSWQANWQSQSAPIVFPNMQIHSSFAIPRPIFDLTKSTTVKIDVEWALSIYRKTGERWQVVAQAGEFPAPRLGLCSLYQVAPMLHCRAPLYGSGPLLATITAVDSTCGITGQTTAPTGYYVIFGSRSEPVPEINPVLEERIPFSTYRFPFTTDERWLYPPLICPGTPINFVSLQFIARTSSITTLNNLPLSQYQAPEGPSAELRAIER